jgi:hypothetical protein
VMRMEEPPSFLKKHPPSAALHSCDSSAIGALGYFTGSSLGFTASSGAAMECANKWTFLV